MNEASVGRDGVEVWRVNAFTDRPFSGNPAGVVPEGDGLPDTRMQSIAAELNDISETVFICRPTVDAADIRLRFFTSTTEVDLCGHATISALFTLAWLGKVSGRTETRTVRAQTAVGVLELGLSFHDGTLRWASMEQLAPRIAAPTGAGHAAEILGLPQDALARNLQVGCCSTGIWACFVPLADVAALARVRVQRARIEDLWPENPELTGVYAFAFVDERSTQGRFFPPPQYGIVEDPVTGTACGALGGYLIANGRMPAGGELIARQGVEMGRSGLVRVRQNDNGRMCISGQACAIFRGRLLV